MSQITACYRSYDSELSIELPYSKSVVARQLLLTYLHNEPLPPVPQAEEALTLCNDDIFVIWHAVHKLRQRADGEPIQIDCGSSATAMRFLMVISVYEKSDTFLLGSDQLMSRVSKDNLSFLEQMGARCQLSSHGVAIAPLSLVRHVHLSIQWSSSQYCSAILMCNSALGLQVTFDYPESTSSYSYLALTQSMLGGKHRQPLERDWSSATFWFQLAMSHPSELHIRLPELPFQSKQPDALICRDALMMGVTAESTGGVLELNSVAPAYRFGVKHIHIAQHLDSFLPLTLSYIRNHKPFTMSGVANLRQKESNRIDTFLEALEWFNVRGFEVGDDTLSWNGTWGKLPDVVMINPYGDHRVAMAFGVFAVTLPHVTTVILDPECAEKSYPQFFAQLMGR